MEFSINSGNKARTLQYFHVHLLFVALQTDVSSIQFYHTTAL